jgi:hypothetical protein
MSFSFRNERMALNISAASVKADVPNQRLLCPLMTLSGLSLFQPRIRAGSGAEADNQ